jgi:hypothetical protein
MTGSVEFFCGVWSTKSEHKAISVTVWSRGVQRVVVNPGAVKFQMWKCICYDDVNFFIVNQNECLHSMYAVV